jgi:hypothetical protein
MVEPLELSLLLALLIRLSDLADAASNDNDRMDTKRVNFIVGVSYVFHKQWHENNDD